MYARRAVAMLLGLIFRRARARDGGATARTRGCVFVVLMLLGGMICHRRRHSIISAYQSRPSPLQYRRSVDLIMRWAKEGGGGSSSASGSGGGVARHAGVVRGSGRVVVYAPSPGNKRTSACAAATASVGSHGACVTVCCATLLLSQLLHMLPAAAEELALAL